jgi:hypothetical protein
MLHAFKAQIDRKVATTNLASELLDVAIIVVANPIFDDLWRLTVEASMDIYRLDNCGIALL